MMRRLVSATFTLFAPEILTASPVAKRYHLLLTLKLGF